MTAVVLELRQVTLAYGSHLLLEDCNLTLRQGKCLSIFGGNGSGKSTLLRTILGLISPKRGKIMLLNRPIRCGSPFIGYLPQSRQSATHHALSGRAWLSAMAQGYRSQKYLAVHEYPRYKYLYRRQPESDETLQKTQFRKNAISLDEIIELVKAQTFIDQPFLQLSGGERQRLLLAQTLLGTPQLLLLDEPLTHLDSKYQHYLGDLIQELCRQWQLTVVLATHDIQPLQSCIHETLRLVGN